MHDTHISLAARFTALRAQSLRLMAGLSEEDCVVQSMPDASPIKWHLAHTTWFFETFILAQFAPSYRVFHEAFKVLFNSYYNAVGEKFPRPQRGLLTRPRLAEVLAYREYVDTAVHRLLTQPHASEQTGAQLAALVELGIQHEQQHQELMLTDLKHLLFCNPLMPAYQATAASTSTGRVFDHVVQEGTSPPSWLECDGGLVAIGALPQHFSFDNEHPRHQVYVKPYALASHPVSNGQYLAFMQDGAYARPELWLSEGWSSVQEWQWQAPFYWRQQDEDGRWQHFTLNGLEELDLDAPVGHVSYFEADAFARWSGAHLPTEAQW
ncbi:MAG: hypothetical protein RLZZ502_148, partial [Pseudomonadota bacterium]